jgi:hypothetical protein
MDPGHNVQQCKSVPREVKKFISSLLMNTQKENAKKAHIMDEIRAELLGYLMSQQDDSDDEDYDDDDMGPQERVALRQAIQASKQAEWEREHLHKLPNR